TSCGPGSANLVVAVAAAFADSSAMLAITGNVPTGQWNRGPFQETGRYFQGDFVNVLRPYVKRSLQPTRGDMLPPAMRQALALMTNGRPGPVHVDVPLNVFRGARGGAGDRAGGGLAPGAVGASGRRSARHRGGRSLVGSGGASGDRGGPRHRAGPRRDRARPVCGGDGDARRDPSLRQGRLRWAPLPGAPRPPAGRRLSLRPAPPHT